MFILQFSGKREQIKNALGWSETAKWLRNGNWGGGNSSVRDKEEKKKIRERRAKERTKYIYCRGDGNERVR